MRKVIPIDDEAIRLAPGETADLYLPMPPGATADDIRSGRAHIDIEVVTPCGCGQMLMRTSQFIWACPNYRWYNRWFGRSHARLKIAMFLAKNSKGGQIC